MIDKMCFIVCFCLSVYSLNQSVILNYSSLYKYVDIVNILWTPLYYLLSLLPLAIAILLNPAYTIVSNFKEALAIL